MKMIPYLILAYALGLFTMMVWIAYKARVKKWREAEDCEKLHRAANDQKAAEAMKKTPDEYTRVFNLDNT